ncbi:hypothetical protein H072_6265 [Dactylellina haptotyla CBS 200.50]|uniref:SPX domain-containing protein n=1 Tax=Dactylellina haptotyla (strain CBS 200.50) TaxID=1284197 RepID=S8BKG8_DACHA|nr:hypothetical protein H072_6265 [Dactylellina haptotyla CBS 200.50]
MKFAKQLEDNLVPEWRIKYLDYKGAKKKLKAVRRAIRNAEAASASTLGYPTPHAAAGIAHRFRSGSVSRSAASSLKQHLSPTSDRGESPTGLRKPASDPASVTPASNGLAASPAVTTASTPGKRKQTERAVLSIREDEAEDEFDRRQSATRRGAMADGDSWKAGKQEEGEAEERIYLNPSPVNGRLAPPAGGYGAISPAPAVPVRPATTIAIPSKPSLPPDLDLPEPARPLEDQPSPILRRRTYDSSQSSKGNGVPKGERTPRFALGDGDPSNPSPQTVRPTDDPASDSPPLATASSIPRNHSHPVFRSVFGSLRHRISGGGRRTSLPNLRNAQIYIEMTEDAQKEFFNYLAAELEKINDFYEAKETEAKERLARIEHQISIMTRNRLFEKERERQAAEEDQTAPAFDWKHPKGIVTGTVLQVKKRISMDTRNGHVKGASHRNSSLEDSSIHPTIAKLGASALEAAAGPAQPNHRTTTNSSLDDYTRRTETQHVRYKTAKRKLKAALIEYYHSLELLKSFSLLNREGFRKILKKFDKTAHTHIANKYLEEKVHSASFASSEEVEKLLGRTEDIFATHYEKGRRKHAVERLRTREHKRPATGAMFRAGWWLGMTIPLLVQALYEAYYRLDDGYGMRHESQVSYLLQIWAGFAFPTLFMLLFSICCRAWVEARINYVFIFEFDTRNNLDWRELMELPAMFAFVQALLMWFSFATFWGDDFDRIWFPLIYVILGLLVIFNPFKFGYFHSRKWLLYTLYRLFWAGVYPVEFRDFWSGDIFCSMTYTLGNIPLFFCLWSKNWDNPTQCNSSHSRLLGFFTCLPSIWRLLQCFRRYHDTRNAFPHLANAGKYGCGILYYMTLSMWRIDKGDDKLKAAFILFAGLNSLYTSTWDLLMDWSLLNWYAPNRLLRTELAFRQPSAYYLAMITDPIIRFSWIFYIIFVNEIQHSALLSFMVSLAELGRRFVWCFFRMENEHCANVNKFRAYKDDVPLPYNVPFPSVPSTSRFQRAPSLAGRTPRITTAAPRVTGAEARVDEEIAAVSGGLTPLTIGRRPSVTTTLPAGATVTTTGTAKTPSAIEAGPTTSSPTMRRTSATSTLPERTPLLRAWTLATTAHAQDFERKRPPSRSVLADASADVSGSAPGRFRGYLNSTAIYDDDDDDDDSESEEDRIRMNLGSGYHGADGVSEGGYAPSLADDAVEGMAGLSLRRTRTGTGTGRRDADADAAAAAEEGSGTVTPGYRGTGAVLSPTIVPQQRRRRRQRQRQQQQQHQGGASPGIGPSSRAAYSGRDYERRGSHSGEQE